MAEVFLADHLRRLPVLSGGRLVGQISRRDLLRAMDDFGSAHSSSFLVYSVQLSEILDNSNRILSKGRSIAW